VSRNSAACLLIGALVFGVVGQAATPAHAEPSGATRTLEIVGGGSVMYYGAQISAQNRKSKGARKEAEGYFDGSLAPLTYGEYKFVARESPGQERADSKALSLEDLRGRIIAVAAADSMAITGDPADALTSADVNVKTSALKRAAFETLRACWNAYLAAPAAPAPATATATANGDAASTATPSGGPAPSGGGSRGRHMFSADLRSSDPFGAAGLTPVPSPLQPGKTPDCMQPLLITKVGIDGAEPTLVLPTVGLDVVDTAAAFAGAPSLTQQVASQQVGGNRVENQQRSFALALLAMSYLDIKRDGYRSYIALVKKPPSTLEALAPPPDVVPKILGFGTSCLFGASLTASSCVQAVGSIASQAVSGISAADACAFARRSWLPSYSRIQNKQDKDPIYGQPPGC
jgi:hypothetical protein